MWVGYLAPTLVRLFALEIYVWFEEMEGRTDLCLTLINCQWDSKGSILC